MPTKQRREAKPNAITLLKEDHRQVSALFERFERSRQDGAKKKLADQICDELTAHAEIEEQIFYPAVRQAVRDDDMMDEATVEHATAKALIKQIRAASPGDPMYDAKLTVLSEYIKHHVKEEQGEMFPKARKSGVDLQELGARMASHKQRILRRRQG
ncbi:MAG: hemerythrin domain-containing protein [Deltaproteobacteria bacterium]|nr:hemerythrin domain-containing protein [Deltaproteobacteria bacterium]